MHPVASWVSAGVVTGGRRSSPDPVAAAEVARVYLQTSGSGGAGSSVDQSRWGLKGLELPREGVYVSYALYDRGLVQPGMAADLVVLDPDTVQPVTEDVVHDFPNNGWRMRELAEGIHYTVVNGEVLLEKGTHTGSYPGRVLHNARYQNGRS